jgi:hypothetical protein
MLEDYAIIAGTLAALFLAWLLWKWQRPSRAPVMLKGHTGEVLHQSIQEVIMRLRPRCHGWTDQDILSRLERLSPVNNQVDIDNMVNKFIEQHVGCE